jgi:hypothetical protein
MKRYVALTPENLKAVNFRRLTGVYPETFEKMVEILSKAHLKKKARGGRPDKLSIESVGARILA